MLFHDPNWPRASDWIAQGSEEPEVVIAGCPANASVTPGHYDQGPGAIRSALSGYSLHSFETDSSLQSLRVKDIGDAAPEALADTLMSFHRSVALFLGGDNGITRYGVAAVAASRGMDLANIGVITFDAHLDVRSLELGQINGNPIRGLLEDGVKGGNIVQIGLQSFANSPAYASFAGGCGIRLVGREEVHHRGIEAVVKEAVDALKGRTEALYVDVDLDVIDRFAVPGCPGARPGGLSVAEMRRAIRLIGMIGNPVGIDFCELDPARDVHGLTASTAAVLILEFLAGFQHRAAPQREPAE